MPVVMTAENNAMSPSWQRPRCGVGPIRTDPSDTLAGSGRGHRHSARAVVDPPDIGPATPTALAMPTGMVGGGGPVRGGVVLVGSGVLRARFLPRRAGGPAGLVAHRPVVGDVRLLPRRHGAELPRQP